MNTFLKGDSTATITLALAEGFDYSGKTVCLEYQGVKRSFSGATAGGTLAFFFNAEETAPMSLGTYPVRAWIEDDNGNVTTINNADVKMRVTDCIADVRSGSAIYLDVRGGLFGIDGLPERYTDEDVRNKINEILLRLGGTVAMLLLCALPVFGASLSLHTAPKGVIYNDQQVVTNATLDVSDLVTTGQLATAVGAIPAPDFTVSNDTLVATIEATAPTPTADAIGAVSRDFVAEEFDSGKDYKTGDVVRIDGKFYVFVYDWRHQWGGNPVDYEAAEELVDLGEVMKYRNARDFLQLGYGGTNAPSYKKIFTGWENDKPCYFMLEPTGWIIDGPFQNQVRMINQEIRVTTNNWNSYWSFRLPDALQRNDVVSMSPSYFSQEFEKSPTSPWYVYSYLTNNYLTKETVEYNYLAKTDAANTYITETAADGKYSTPAGVASAISSALGGFKPQYLYNSYGNYRLDANGKVQRQTHNGYNVNWTNDSTGVVFLYSTPDSWTCNHPTLGEIHFTRSDGVMYCNEYPPVRATEDYPNTTVLSFGAPIGTMRAIPNASGSLLWNDYKQFADADSVVDRSDFDTATNTLASAISTVETKTPNDITRTANDATLVNGTNALVYIRQASSSLAGLMTAADKTKLNGIPSDVGTTASTALSTAEGAQAIVMTWENFLDGSNVVFSITNYISGTYTLDTAKLKILELKNGVYEEVYNSRDEILLHIQDFKDNDFNTATNQVIGAVSEAIEDKADRDWGKYTSAGGEAPSNTVYMTAPNTVFAGGMEYERVEVGEGTICVLTTHGAPVWTQGDEGTFKFQDDGGTNYFGFAKTDSYTIGANTDGITVSGGMVTLLYNITMSGRPCIWYKADLTAGTEWEQLNLPDGSPVAGASHAVTWEANPDPGTQVCYINVGNAPSGFFKATVEVAGSAKFMTNMTADLSGGIFCTDGVHKVRPVYNNGSVTWEVFQ